MPYIILAELYAKEGQVDALKEALTKVSQDVEKHEKGTYQYQVCSGDEDPRKVIVFEEYEDQTAHLAHRDGEAFKAFKSRFSDLTEGELKITKYHCFASVNRKQGAPSGKL